MRSNDAKGGVQKEKCKRRNVKGGVQGEMQEVECIPEKEPLDASQHARWPAATCGSKLPTANVPLRALDGLVRFDFISVGVRSALLGVLRFGGPAI